VLEHVLEYER
jgi:hypothetical protein